MKKTIITLLFYLFVINVYAQDKPFLPMCIYVNGGLNLSVMDPSDYYFSSKANPGFSGGAELRTDGDFYFLLGLHYVSMNPTLTNKVESQTEKVNMQYFQVPLMVGVQIVKSQDVKQCLHASIGGSFSTIMSVSENDLGITKDDIKKLGYNFKIGIGADLWNFIFDINYNRVLSHVYETPGYNNSAKLTGWEFLLGYKFILHKDRHKID